jgi:uncharacterized protein YjbJ (UPF0337 family)
MDVLPILPGRNRFHRPRRTIAVPPRVGGSAAPGYGTVLVLSSCPSTTEAAKLWLIWRDEMSEFTDKAKGLANQAAGKAKQGVGSAVGSDKLQAEGAAQEAKGTTQKAVGDAKGAVKDTANKVADSANDTMKRH